jgi:uncharacterized protein YdeI (YjbR/CyaY-like superfamily)
MKVVLDERNTFYAANRRQWRAWLKKNYRTEKEIRLVFYKAHTGKARVSYNDAVEEALCFGWIDSTVRKMDAERYAQRFSPRKPGSPYSQANKERLKALIRKGLVAKEILASFRGELQAKFEVPPDILRAIRADPEAWTHFRKFSRAYIRIRIAYIEGARNRPEEFEKRLRNFIRMTGKNRQIGFGGIEKYY